MRKVTRDAAQAFLDGRSGTFGNTTVTYVPAGKNGLHWPTQAMTLHGNLIAEMLNGNLRVTLAGWPTPTTRERVNGLLELFCDDVLHVAIGQDSGEQYIIRWDLAGNRWAPRKMDPNAWYTFNRAGELVGQS